jgi:hypothetical protein
MSSPAPRQFSGVMVSSTFEDLKEHRKALMEVIGRGGFHEVVMENDSAKAMDVIDSSLQMVRDAAVYILVIAHKYGQVPTSRNPDGLSLTEMEYNEAVRLGRPVLLFLMGENHLVRKGDVEPDPVKAAKLAAFRERAKVGRVYATFESLEDFRTKAAQAVAGLPKASEPVKGDPIPRPPAFYAEPPYIGSHAFVGRAAELDRLDDWASASDTHPVLLFEAIGGSGKSMLTWEWTTKRSTRVRQDWAGRFWYSFYERGAVMADFCRRALAYMTGTPLEHLTKMKTQELAGRLVQQLRGAPWLLVLDGLERVLVAYHRIDAAQLTDDAAEQPTDEISHRDPCVAIRPEDDDLLRLLAGAERSKVLITSRLIPRVLLNAASQAIPGVQRIALPGLRPADAEALFRSCGVGGDSKAIQDYLRTNCDCHPLVTGVLAGLVTQYRPDRGNFDVWAKDPAGGGRLNLAELDLKQKRNHILRAAIEALAAESRQVLATMAILSEAVDYTTLAALSSLRQETIEDLERRGLVQYDGQTRRYDLHPVVRSIAAGGLRPEERAGQGQRVVDYFSRRTHSPYEEAETIEDVRDGLRVVRTLLQMGKYQGAYEAFKDGLSDALLFNLEANAEVLSVLRPFFPAGWSREPGMVQMWPAGYLSNTAAVALSSSGMTEDALAAYGSTLVKFVRGGEWENAATVLGNTTEALRLQNRLAATEKCDTLAFEIATLKKDKLSLFMSLLSVFETHLVTGRLDEAESTWRTLNRMGRGWPRRRYRPGDAEYWYVQLRIRQGDLTEGDLDRAEGLAEDGKNREVIRGVHRLRGQWRLERCEWTLAAESFAEAVRRAREVGVEDREAESGLSLARFHCGELTDPREEAKRLEGAGGPSLELAELWTAIGDGDRAKRHALAAYNWAWADGEPYVHRWELDKSRALLEKLGAEVPVLPSYDPAKAPKLPWEDEVRAAIQKL